MTSIRRLFIFSLFAAIAGIAKAGLVFWEGDLRYNIQSDGETVYVDKYLAGDNKDIVIPSTAIDSDDGKSYTVTGIARQAFYNADINSITFPPTLEDLDVYAMWKSKIKTVNFSEGLKKIGYGAFKDCVNLTSIKLPESVEELGYVFTATGFDGFAFAGCTSLEEVTVGNKVKSISTCTFQGCTSLRKVTMGNDVEDIGERVFEDCGSLQSLELPAAIKTIGRAAFMNAGFTDFTFPGTVRILPSSAFLHCRALKAFTIEEGVEEVGKQSFAACYGYDMVRVPNSVEWIRTDAFQGSDKVTEIHLGTGLRRLGHAALAVWSPSIDTNTPEWSLTDIYCESTVPPVYEPNDEHFEELSADFFFGAKEFTDELKAEFFANVNLRVPAEAVEAYKKADIWKEFANIIPLGNPDDAEITVTTADPDFAEVTLTIDGEPVELNANPVKIDSKIGSVILVSPTGKSVISNVTANGSNVTPVENGAFEIVVSQAAVSINVDWEYAVAVKGGETLLDGEKAGELMLVYDDRELAAVKLPIGQTLSFKAIPMPGYEFLFVADKEGDDAGTSYTAVSDDVDEGITFTAVFKKKDGGITAVPDGLDPDAPVAVYTVSGLRIAGATYSSLHTLPAGVYVVKIGGKAVKICR